jgi:hypothetical protein
MRIAHAKIYYDILRRLKLRPDDTVLVKTLLTSGLSSDDIVRQVCIAHFNKDDLKWNPGDFTG